jgi:hypothetical protein
VINHFPSTGRKPPHLLFLTRKRKISSGTASKLIAGPPRPTIERTSVLESVLHKEERATATFGVALELSWFATFPFRVTNRKRQSFMNGHSNYLSGDSMQINYDKTYAPMPDSIPCAIPFDVTGFYKNARKSRQMFWKTSWWRRGSPASSQPSS